MKLLALDVGTTASGYCVIDTDTYKPLAFDKVTNDDLMWEVRSLNYDVLVYEAFACYGMAVSQSVFESVEWNGRYKQVAIEREKPVYSVFRMDEKMTLCHRANCKDSNIRQALIDRFARYDFKNGKGTKNNPDWFYGFSKDMWSAYAVGVTFLDMQFRRTGE